ncbi:hypothetical protein CARUB_v10024969mg [Capsella rubella]|uniref:F-box domain-containing protein n=1 Tax=Capsella rubella TaxID=81985 RepID=R0HGC9_9BRAS|nr:putative F-box/kelch-repeat protein At5g03000 [Capsella rubella]EOA28739.1 hypothetical protein CARUB_v10024969mg [Capsella rubella]
MKNSSSPMFFSSLPEENVLHCLSCASRFSLPTLSLVSLYLHSLIASPEFKATRTRNGITEDYLYVCLDLNKEIPNPSWFTVSLLPKQQKQIPVPSFPHQHPKSSSVVSISSDIYIIGGRANGMRSNRVLRLDGQIHQWLILPNMLQPREAAAADVIDGKIDVIGGFGANIIQDWGEVYDPNNQTWEPILTTTLNLATQVNVVPGKLVMGEKVYAMNGLIVNLENGIFLFDNSLRLMYVSHQNLF